MRSLQEVKQAVGNAIDANADRIEKIAETIWKHPETGFREFKTARLAADTLRDLGLDVREGIAFTGLRADLTFARPGPKFAILGEMDALLIPEAKESDRETGAYHGCGHHTHITSTLGAAMGLCLSGAAEDLSGTVAFMGCPAEECIEIEYRLKQMGRGRIKAIGGKPAMIREGAFDDIDIAAMIHLGNFYSAMDSNAFVNKQVHFAGRASHAASPQGGVNALDAAGLAMHALSLMQRSFSAMDPKCRVHGILSKGGESVNVIPSAADLEYCIRASSVPALQSISGQFDRAMKGCAAALGARCRIRTVPGYHAMKNDPELYDLYLNEAKEVCGIDPDAVRCISKDPGSTDMGDVSAILPAIHPFGGCGVEGRGHTASFRCTAPRKACTDMAKMLAFLAVDLLYGDAEKGRKIAAKKKDCLSVAEYIREMDGLGK